jgi:hypothetical protein
MSGGSYNYLCYKDGHQILEAMGDLEAMSARLAGLGYANDAAAETEDLLVLMRQALNRVGVRMRRLEKVWHAVEWWDSADYGEDQVKEALAEYRKELEPK